MFKNIFKKAAEKMIPVISAGISALINVNTMNKVIEFLDIDFY